MTDNNDLGARRPRGAITFDVDGKSVTFLLNTNAMCRFQDLANETFITAMNRLRKDPGDMSLIRRLVCAAMPRDATSGKYATEEVAGDLMDQMGILPISARLNEALAAKFSGEE